MVVSVPRTPVVERDQEEVSAVEGLEHRLAATPPGDSIAKRSVEPAEERGVQQEVANLCGLALQDLLDQVVDDVTVIPGEACDEAGHVVASLHRERGQLERGDPALGALVQRSPVVRRQLQSHHPVEVRRSLIGYEAEVGGADLNQVATTAEPC